MSFTQRVFIFFLKAFAQKFDAKLGSKSFEGRDGVTVEGMQPSSQQV